MGKTLPGITGLIAKSKCSDRIALKVQKKKKEKREIILRLEESREAGGELDFAG